MTIKNFKLNLLITNQRFVIKPLVYLNNTLKTFLKIIKTFVFKRIIRVKHIWLKSKNLYDFLIELTIYFNKETKIGVYSLKLNIKIVYFFTNTFIGYIVYLIAIIYGLADIAVTHCFYYAFFCSFYVLITCGELCILLQLPTSRRVISSLVTEEYLLQHLGNKTGIHNFSKAIFPLLFFMVITVWSIMEGPPNYNEIYRLNIATIM